uniref:Survival of motor neuron-related-splicing factor 30 n=1 Tax=Lepeophtheirus salmonis TaxID=72036 RepID=D3PGV2_LEPSM|nr:Survival of motor neuron-related-splicing factor 30 [Lepeophtheirus salmonis]
MFSNLYSYQEAVIEEISTNGEVSVKFRGTEHVVVTSLGLLKISKLGNIKNLKNRKELLAKQKEYLKKKKAKKLERLKVMEEEREQEKNKWKVFSSKAFGKKGFVKKSIFKTPENAKGRVGIGTCGVSGQNMTTFSSASKYRKGN